MRVAIPPLQVAYDRDRLPADRGQYQLGEDALRAAAGPSPFQATGIATCAETPNVPHIGACPRSEPAVTSSGRCLVISQTTGTIALPSTATLEGAPAPEAGDFDRHAPVVMAAAGAPSGMSVGSTPAMPRTWSAGSG
jgi:hypothetical protein